MDDDKKKLREQLDKFKPTKKKLSVPKEFLEDANSYEDKLSAIRIVTDREAKKVVQLIKDMLKK
jgi:uncharacterized protein YajQ (UPF0234 family)